MPIFICPMTAVSTICRFAPVSNIYMLEKWNRSLRINSSIGSFVSLGSTFAVIDFPHFGHGFGLNSPFTCCI